MSWWIFLLITSAAIITSNSCDKLNVNTKEDTCSKNLDDDSLCENQVC